MTGGARGIGEGCVRVFHEAGSHVVIADRDEKGGSSLASELNARAAKPKKGKKNKSAEDQAQNEIAALEILLQDLRIDETEAEQYLTMMEGGRSAQQQAEDPCKMMCKRADFRSMSCYNDDARKPDPAKHALGAEAWFCPECSVAVCFICEPKAGHVHRHGGACVKSERRFSASRAAVTIFPELKTGLKGCYTKSNVLELTSCLSDPHVRRCPGDLYLIVAGSGSFLVEA